LYGDFRNSAEPAAAREFNFTFIDAQNGMAEAILSEKSYSRRIRLKSRTAAALIAGWDEALNSIMAEAAAEF